MRPRKVRTVTGLGMRRKYHSTRDSAFNELKGSLIVLSIIGS
jgi:hypothetical protein